MKIVLDDEWYVVACDREYTLHHIRKTDKEKCKRAKNDFYDAVEGYFGKLSQAIYRWIESRVNEKAIDTDLLGYVEMFQDECKKLCTTLSNSIEHRIDYMDGDDGK